MLWVLLLASIAATAVAAAEWLLLLLLLNAAGRCCCDRYGTRVAAQEARVQQELDEDEQVGEADPHLILCNKECHAGVDRYVGSHAGRHRGGAVVTKQDIGLLLLECVVGSRA